MTAWSPPRILFVDDEPELLETLADLWGMQYDVRTALGGPAGLVAVAEHRPHVVVSDMRMPGMDGATFLARVRKRAPDTVRILLTGHADLDAAIRAVNEGGVFAFLTKPCPPAVLGPELERAYTHHQGLVAERAKMDEKLQAMTSQLAHAEQLATLGTLSASLGHEMNNALAILECAVEEVRGDAAAGQVPDPELLESLVHGKDRLLAQARGALALARRDPRELRPIDLAATVRDVTSVLATLGLTRRATVDVATDGGPLWVLADRTEIEQIVINLVKNSIDALAGRKSGGNVGIRVRAREARVQVEVTDNGAGIPPAVVARVFEPYFTTKAPGAGTGLGLPLVKRLVDGMHGTVTLESTFGTGTTVTIDLPSWTGGARTRSRTASKAPAPA